MTFKTGIALNETAPCARVRLDAVPPDVAGWPMIVLRSPKGWTGPRTVDGLRVEGTWRSHQVPLSEVRTNPAHLTQLERLAEVLPAG